NFRETRTETAERHKFSALEVHPQQVRYRCCPNTLSQSGHGDLYLDLDVLFLVILIRSEEQARCADVAPLVRGHCLGRVDCKKLDTPDLVTQGHGVQVHGKPGSAVLFDIFLAHVHRTRVTFKEMNFLSTEYFTQFDPVQSVT